MSDLATTELFVENDKLRHLLKLAAGMIRNLTDMDREEEETDMLRMIDEALK